MQVKNLILKKRVVFFHRGQDIEKVHIQFCKRLLGVRKGTCNDFIYCELGRFPLQIIRKQRIFKYWIKLRNTNNIILRAVGLCEDMEKYKDGWLMKVKQELNELDLRYIWNLPNVDTIVYNVIKERIYDTFKRQNNDNSKMNSVYTPSKRIQITNLP